MRTCAVIALAVIVFLCDAVRAQPRHPAPKREVRAVWITTASGLDWPRTFERTEQQESLRGIVNNLKAAHFNTILFQVRARGDAYYRSGYEPWAENLTGTLGKDPGWDPLAFLLNVAHESGLEVHAWFNVYKVRGPSSPGRSTPLHPTRRFEMWVHDVGGDGWIDPGVPAVRDYLVHVALDLVRNYDIDGINFDFLRYPGKDFPDEETYRRYGHGVDRDEWRRGNIDKFVAAFYDSAIRIKPMLKVGSSPLGVFSGGSGSEKWGAYYSYYQDSRGWIRNGKHDYLSPQLYWDLGATKDDPDFADLARTWKSNAYGRQMWTGIGAYKPEVMRELPAQIDSARAIGVDGQVFFRYDFVRRADVFGDRYATFANIPPMAWKDSIPPLAPTNLVVTETQPNIIHLEWRPPPAAEDGDRASKYDIFRSVTDRLDPEDPSSLLAVTTGHSTSYEDTLRPTGGYRYFYAVSALDKGNNEGPVSTPGSVILSRMLSLRGRLSGFTSLSASVSHDGSTTLVAYRIPKRSQVLLQVAAPDVDSTRAGRLTLAGGEKDPGTYVVGIPEDRLEPGSYILRLLAGDMAIEHPLEIRH